MVILETAAIGAAGYGLYRGGDAVARKGKETHKELQREKVRQSQRSDFHSKSKTRKERIAQLVNLKENKGNNNSSRTTNTSTSTSEAPVAANVSASASATTTSTSTDDRHASVMAKLKDSRQSVTKTKKNHGPTSKFKGLFGKRK